MGSLFGVKSLFWFFLREIGIRMALGVAP